MTDEQARAYDAVEVARLTYAVPAVERTRRSVQETRRLMVDAAIAVAGIAAVCAWPALGKPITGVVIAFYAVGAAHACIAALRELWP